MTDDERREMARNNYAAQMEMLGYQPDGNPKDLVEVVRCKDCKYLERLPWLDDETGKAMVCRRHAFTGMRTEDWFCADGERR